MWRCLRRISDSNEITKQYETFEIVCRSWNIYIHKKIEFDLYRSFIVDPEWNHSTYCEIQWHTSVSLGNGIVVFVNDKGICIVIQIGNANGQFIQSIELGYIDTIATVISISISCTSQAILLSRISKHIKYA